MDYNGVAFRDKEEGKIIFLTGEKGRKETYRSSGFLQKYLTGNSSDVFILPNISNLFELSKYYLTNTQIKNRIEEGIYVPLSDRELCTIKKVGIDSDWFNKEMKLNHYGRWETFQEIRNRL